MRERGECASSALHIRRWQHRSVLGIGEAMVEFAALREHTYRRGVAGDTLNTCWHMAQMLGAHAQVGYYTRVGIDRYSDELVAFIAASRMDARHIARDPQRSLGLYVISLVGAERHFSYWRDASAARRLADDPEVLAEALQGHGLVHVPGITLAVIGDQGRRHLLAALADARRAGTVVSFDPNVRPRLWRDGGELRAAAGAMLEVTDIALPSFDDESLVWGDADPEATLTRLEGAGVGEIVVKNGAGDAVFSVGGVRGRSPTPPVTSILDTTGAGDSFNAGYLAARLLGQDAHSSCEAGHRVAGLVIGHYGALAPTEALKPIGDWLLERTCDGRER